MQELKVALKTTSQVVQTLEGNNDFEEHWAHIPLLAGVHWDSGADVDGSVH